MGGQKSIAIHLQFVLQYAPICVAVLSVPLNTQEREIFQYSSHLYRDTPSHLYCNTLGKILVIVVTGMFPRGGPRTKTKSPQSSMASSTERSYLSDKGKFLTLLRLKGVFLDKEVTTSLFKDLESRAAKRGGGFKRGRFPIWTCPFLFVLFVHFGTFPIFPGFSRFARGLSGDFPDRPFSLSQPSESTYEEQSRKGPRHNLDLSRKKRETPRFGNRPV